MSDAEQYLPGPYLLKWTEIDNNVRQPVAVVFADGQWRVYGHNVDGELLDELLAQGCTLTPLVPSTELDAARQRIAALEAEVERMRNAPQMPQPDWSKAPDWAQWWAVEASGWAVWLRAEPSIDAYNGDRWCGEPDANGNIDDGQWDAHIDLPLGIDWRTTLQQRPQEPQP